MELIVAGLLFIYVTFTQKAEYEVIQNAFLTHFFGHFIGHSSVIKQLFIKGGRGRRGGAAMHCQEQPKPLPNC